MTLTQWQRKITRRVFVDSGEMRLSELCDLLDRMWDDARNEALKEIADQKGERG